MTRSRDVADTQDNLGGAVAPFVAGKNKIINGDFGVWQRGTSFTNPSVFQYTADRWQGVFNGTVTGAVTTQQAFTYGTAPVAGYEGTYFMRQVTASQSGSSVQAIAQRIEDVRTFANQTVTFSFWAKADTSRNWTCRFIQSFGTSGSGDVSTANSANFAVTTSWQRFSATFTLPSIAGKTIGAGSYLYAIIDGPINTGQTMDVWGVQVEAGNVMSPFTTASGSIGGELALCQRYYFRTTGGGTFQPLCFGFASSATNVMGYVQYPVTMRTSPSSIDFSQISCNDSTVGNPVSAVAFSGTEYGPQASTLNFTTSGMTTFRPTKVLQYSTSAGYLGLSAEL
jgi:hypothetical protein